MANENRPASQIPGGETSFEGIASVTNDDLIRALAVHHGMTEDEVRSAFYPVEREDGSTIYLGDAVVAKN